MDGSAGNVSKNRTEITSLSKRAGLWDTSNMSYKQILDKMSKIKTKFEAKSSHNEPRCKRVFYSTLAIGAFIFVMALYAFVVASYVLLTCFGIQFVWDVLGVSLSMWPIIGIFVVYELLMQVIIAYIKKHDDGSIGYTYKKTTMSIISWGLLLLWLYQFINVIFIMSA